MFQERTQKGAFTNLFNHMKTQDHEMFFKYTRMLPEQFGQLLDLLKPKLLKRSRRECLSPELHLAMTLNSLAHGGSFQNAERKGEDVTDGDWRIITRNDTNLTPVGRLGSNIAPNVVIQLKNKLADYLMDLGSVSWQLNIVNRGHRVIVTTFSIYCGGM
nr:unnamed protein product [Callosobruchus analis]